MKFIWVKLILQKNIKCCKNENSWSKSSTNNSWFKTLKKAVDSAFEAYLADTENSIYCIGSVVGPHPFPMMVRDFQSVIGFESRNNFFEHENKLPDNVVACVGVEVMLWNFSGFIDDKEVELYGVEPMGKKVKILENIVQL